MLKYLQIFCLEFVLKKYRYNKHSLFVLPYNISFFFTFLPNFLLNNAGLCASSKESILHILKGPPGNACVLVVGGVAEALRSVPGTYKLVLKHRKGFVKLALQAG